MFSFHVITDALAFVLLIRTRVQELVPQLAPDGSYSYLRVNRSMFLDVFRSKLLSSRCFATCICLLPGQDCLLYLFPPSHSRKETQKVSVYFFLFVSASFLGDIKSHSWQYLMRGSHRSNIHVQDVGLCVFMSVLGWILIALRVELTEVTHQRPQRSSEVVSGDRALCFLLCPYSRHSAQNS